MRPHAYHTKSSDIISASENWRPIGMPLDSPQLLSRLSPFSFSGWASEETRLPWISPCHTKKSPLQRKSFTGILSVELSGSQLSPWSACNYLLRSQDFWDNPESLFRALEVTRFLITTLCIFEMNWNLGFYSIKKICLEPTWKPSTHSRS